MRKFLNKIVDKIIVTYRVHLIKIVHFINPHARELEKIYDAAMDLIITLISKFLHLPFMK